VRQGNKRKPECEHHCASPKYSSPWTTEHKQQEPFIHRSSLKKFLIAFLTTGFVTFCRYYTALSHSGLIVLTTPYLDVGGSGEVITMARTLYRQESPENVLGVVSADFTLRYFYKLLTKVYPLCDVTSKYACFVMDNDGFLVLHVDFMQSSVTELHLGHVHITKKERHIAEDLISKGFLVKKECRNVEAIQKQSFYEVNVPPSGVDELRGNSACKYKVAPISGTNVYLGNQEQYSVAIFTTDFISP